MTDAPSGAYELLEAALGTITRSGGTVWITLLPIVDEPRSGEMDQAVLDLVSRYETIVLDFRNVSKVGSDWLRLLKKLSVLGDQQGVRVGWLLVPEIVKRTADWLGIAAGLHFDENEDGD